MLTGQVLLPGCWPESFHEDESTPPVVTVKVETQRVWKVGIDGMEGTEATLSLLAWGGFLPTSAEPGIHSYFLQSPFALCPSDSLPYSPTNLCADSLTTSFPQVQASGTLMLCVYKKPDLSEGSFRLSTCELNHKVQQQMPTDSAVSGLRETSCEAESLPWELWICRTECLVKCLQVLLLPSQPHVPVERGRRFLQLGHTEWEVVHEWIHCFCFLLKVMRATLLGRLSYLSDLGKSFSNVCAICYKCNRALPWSQLLFRICIPSGLQSTFGWQNCILILLTCYPDDCHDWPSCPSFFFSVSEWNSAWLFCRKHVNYLTLLYTFSQGYCDLQRKYKGFNNFF